MAGPHSLFPALRSAEAAGACSTPPSLMGQRGVMGALRTAVPTGPFSPDLPSGARSDGIPSRGWPPRPAAPRPADLRCRGRPHGDVCSLSPRLYRHKRSGEGSVRPSLPIPPRRALASPACQDGPSPAQQQVHSATSQAPASAPAPRPPVCSPTPTRSWRPLKRLSWSILPPLTRWVTGLSLGHLVPDGLQDRSSWRGPRPTPDSPTHRPPPAAYPPPGMLAPCPPPPPVLSVARTPCAHRLHPLPMCTGARPPLTTAVPPGPGHQRPLRGPFLHGVHSAQEQGVLERRGRPSHPCSSPLSPKWPAGPCSPPPSPLCPWPARTQAGPPASDMPGHSGALRLLVPPPAPLLLPALRPPDPRSYHWPASDLPASRLSKSAFAALALCLERRLALSRLPPLWNTPWSTAARVRGGRRATTPLRPQPPASWGPSWRPQPRLPPWRLWGAGTLYLGDSGGVAQHAVQVLLQALVLLRELLDAPGQAQEGAAHSFLPFKADVLLHWRPRRNETKRLRFGA